MFVCDGEMECVLSEVGQAVEFCFLLLCLYSLGVGCGGVEGIAPKTNSKR